MDRLRIFKNQMTEIGNDEAYKRNSRAIAMSTVGLSRIYTEDAIKTHIEDLMIFLKYSEKSKDAAAKAIKNDLEGIMKDLDFSYGIKSEIPVVSNGKSFLKNVLDGLYLVNVYMNEKPIYKDNSEKFLDYHSLMLNYTNQIIPENSRVDAVERKKMITDSKKDFFTEIKNKNKLKNLKPYEMFGIAVIAKAKKHTQERTDDFIELLAKKYYLKINNFCRNSQLFSENELNHYYSNLKGPTDQELIDKEIKIAQDSIKSYFLNNKPSSFKYGESDETITLKTDFFKDIVKEIITNENIINAYKDNETIKNNINDFSISLNFPQSKKPNDEKIFNIIELAKIELEEYKKNNPKIVI